MHTLAYPHVPHDKMLSVYPCTMYMHLNNWMLLCSPYVRIQMCRYAHWMNVPYRPPCTLCNTTPISPCALYVTVPPMSSYALYITLYSLPCLPMHSIYNPTIMSPDVLYITLSPMFPYALCIILPPSHPMYSL